MISKVEVMDTDTELNQENLYDAIQKELLDPPPAEPAKKTKRRAGAKNNKKTKKQEPLDLSSDSSGDPDFEPPVTEVKEEVTEPSTSNGMRMRTRNRSRSSAKKH